MNKVLASSVLASLISLAGSSLAHGPNHHGSAAAKPGASVTAPEQQAWGIAASPNPGARRIDIRMGDDMRFTPSHIEVKLGETVRLVVHNDGKVLHELVLGTRAELDKHAALMLKHPNMAHDDPWMAHVDPGKSGDIYWTFNRAGSFEFACLIPGHFQAGMRGTLRVSTSGVDSGAAPAANTAEEWVEAVIRRVDPDQSRLTLRHGEIKSLDMPPMTMVFHVRDARLLNGLAAGDSVRFRTVQDDGRYIVTAIEKR